MSFHAPSREKVTMEVRQDESSSWNVDASRTDETISRDRSLPRLRSPSSEPSPRRSWLFEAIRYRREIIPMFVFFVCTLLLASNDTLLEYLAISADFTAYKKWRIISQ